MVPNTGPAQGVHIIPRTNPNEDAAGPLALGFVTAFISIVVGTGAAVFQRLLQRAVDIKKENDLTV
jgi:hypothetical protein